MTNNIPSNQSAQVSWLEGVIREKSAEIERLRAALQGFIDFQVTDYYRQADAATRYCTLRKDARKLLSGDSSAPETSVPLSLVKEARLYMQHDRKCWGSTHEDDCDCGFVKIAEKLKPFINGSPVETSARCPGGEISSVGGNATAVSSADSASSLGKAAASDGVRLYPEADARTSNPSGTFICPVCGYDKMHYHPPGSIRWHEKHLPIFKSLMENDWPFAEERTHYPASHSLLFYSPRINALWQLYQRIIERSADETAENAEFLFLKNACVGLAAKHAISVAGCEGWPMSALLAFQLACYRLDGVRPLETTARCTCESTTGVHEFTCQFRREGDDGKGAVKAGEEP